MIKLDPAEIVDQIFDLYERYGSADYIGEPVSQIEHMSQAAALAVNQNFDDEVVLAAFFHDIGHLCVQRSGENDMNGFGTKSHETIGADYLFSLGFSERLTRLVKSHVPAKRYLTFRDPSYYNRLSVASKETLMLQGGIMSEKEAIEFEKDPLFNLYITLRKWDEMAKETDVPIIDLDILKKKTLAHLETQSSRRS
jgi:phosphonate degradation associated HDIG domain protein